MDSTLWDQLAEYFDQALDMPETERHTFLNSIKQQDVQLWEELVSLLRFSVNADSYFGEVKELIPGDSEEVEVNPDPYNFVGTRINQYQILDTVGMGGMGVVYKGRDVELHRIVALKFLPPTLGADHDARVRFYTEARAASKLDHQNVCTIHEIGSTEEGQIYIVMAYYEGETLLDKMEKENLSEEESIDYIRQIALGLQGAHQLNIIHRDIKPGNVMVTAQGVVKILDFGLAKIADQKLTKTGMTMGTVAYMSPELIRGGTPVPASDIWSLGVLLYEMITGLRPFRAMRYEGVMYSIINSEPEYDNELPAELPQYVKGIISTCLQKDPALRYNSAEQLILDIEERSAAPVSRLQKVLDNKPFFKRRKLVGVGVGIALLACLLLLRVFSDKKAIDQESGHRVAILPFSTIPEGNEEAQVLAEGLMYSLANTMVYLDSPENPVNVIPVSSVRQYGIRDVQEARKILDADIVVEGVLSKTERGVNLSLNLIEAKNIQVLGGDTRQIEIDEGFNPLAIAFQEEIMHRFAEILDIPLNSQKQEVIKEQLPQNSGAYAVYLQGLGYLQRFDKPGYIDYAIQLFEETLKLDPLYAPAHAGICEALWEKYLYTADLKYVDQALASCDRSVDLGKDLAPVLISLGNIYLSTGEYSRAEKTLRSALELEPFNPEAYRWLGVLFFSQIKLDSARANFQRAISLRQNNWLYYYELGILLNEHGLHEEAAKQQNIAMKLAPDNYLPVYQLGVIQRSIGNIAEAEAFLMKALEMNPEVVFVRRSLGILYYREQRYEEVNDILGLEVQSSDLMSLIFLADANYWLGYRARAESIWQTITDRAESVLEIDPYNRVARIVMIDALSSVGLTDQALTALASFSDEEMSYPWVSYFLSRIYERSGERDLAFSSIERALQQHFDVYMFENDPWLTDLRNDRSYAVLTERFLNK